MLDDILKHLKKKRSKISLAVISFIIIIYFFSDGEFSLSKLLICLLIVFLAFLIISWGNDNPEGKR